MPVTVIDRRELDATEVLGNISGHIEIVKFQAGKTAGVYGVRLALFNGNVIKPYFGNPANVETINQDGALNSDCRVNTLMEARRIAGIEVKPMLKLTKPKKDYPQYTDAGKGK